MHRMILDMLQCPACGGSLGWSLRETEGDTILTGEARCQECQADYPLREGIGLFLTPDLPREDLWEQVDSNLTQYLREHPDIERRLLETPLEDLNPADLTYRAIALEGLGDYAAAERAEQAALNGLYTTEYLACRERQVEHLLTRVQGETRPVIDLASGRGYLVERLMKAIPAHVVASDFSPRVLRRDRRWAEYKGFLDRLSLLAFDARRMPFKDGAVRTMTTNLGLANIQGPGTLFQELRRVISGSFLAIVHFFPERDGNADLIRQASLQALLYKRPLLEQFRAAGLRVEAANACRSKARPTPEGEIIAGARVDALPAVETELEWCLLVAG